MAAQLILTIKSDGSKWCATRQYLPSKANVAIVMYSHQLRRRVSKYARGGSARKQSARKFYIVIDALQGHFAANG